MNLTKWIRSRAATQQPLNLHAVARERPDLLELAFAGPTPRGWRRSLVDAGVDPYKIVQAFNAKVECAICGQSFSVSGSHLTRTHEMSGDEYLDEFGADRELSSEGFRAAQFRALPIAGIAHWECLWSAHYVIDLILRLHDEGHPLNCLYIATICPSLVYYGPKFFGSWDAALLAAGLDPELLRAIPPHRHWTRPMVIEGLRNLANISKGKSRTGMPDDLRAAMTRYFRTPQAAAKAAGLAYKEINSRLLPRGEALTRLVAAVRSLENLKGRERRTKLDAIYRKDPLNHRLVLSHFGSLRALAAGAGIALRTVAPEMYRDETDVRHDLDLLERKGAPLTNPEFEKANPRLNQVIRKTGWCADRIQHRSRRPTDYPECNPRSGLLEDRMILLRRKLQIGATEVAAMAGISRHSWTWIENGEVKPRPASLKKIERLLEDHQIPVSSAPDTPAG